MGAAPSAHASQSETNAKGQRTFIAYHGTSWENAKQTLDQNAAGILEAGHWGVPLMVFEEEPFYGQDRFDHLLWRMKRRAVL